MTFLPYILSRIVVWYFHYQFYLYVKTSSLLRLWTNVMFQHRFNSVYTMYLYLCIFITKIAKITMHHLMLCVLKYTWHKNMFFPRLWKTDLEHIRICQDLTLRRVSHAFVLTKHNFFEKEPYRKYLLPPPPPTRGNRSNICGIRFTSEQNYADKCECVLTRQAI